jgi:hypothetical protein
VHRHHPLRSEAIHDRCGLFGPDRRAAADRQEQQVDLTDRVGLLVTQCALAGSPK